MQFGTRQINKHCINNKEHGASCVDPSHLHPAYQAFPWAQSPTILYLHLRLTIVRGSGNPHGTSYSLPWPRKDAATSSSERRERSPRIDKPHHWCIFGFVDNWFKKYIKHICCQVTFAPDGITIMSSSLPTTSSSVFGWSKSSGPLGPNPESEEVPGHVVDGGGDEKELHGIPGGVINGWTGCFATMASRISIRDKAFWSKSALFNGIFGTGSVGTAVASLVFWIFLSGDFFDGDGGIPRFWPPSPSTASSTSAAGCWWPGSGQLSSPTAPNCLETWNPGKKTYELLEAYMITL